MRIKSKRLLAAAIVGLLSSSTSAFATNGYFMIGFGAGSVGMGGVGVTAPQDSMCVGGNPACLGEFIQPQFDMGAGLIGVNRRAGEDGFTAGGYSWSGVNTYLLPGMGFVWPFDDQLSIGIAALGNGGAGTTYNPNFFSPSKTDPMYYGSYIGVDLVQLIVPITVSYKVNEKHTLGVSVVPARQRFLAQGLEKFTEFSVDPTSVTGNGHDFANGVGIRVGWLGHYMDNRVQLGATWASKVYMEKFHHYQGLFAGAGGFDAPENYAIGISVKPVENLTVAMDVQKILYSDVPSVGNPGPTVMLNGGNIADAWQPLVHKLGGPDGMGFGWTDQTVYKFGVAYKPNDNWTLRAGYNYAKSPIPDSQLMFNLLAPATVEKHYTLGFTYNLGEQSILGFGSEGAVSMAYTHGLLHRQTADLLYVATPTITAIQASLEMKLDTLELAYTLKF